MAASLAACGNIMTILATQRNIMLCNSNNIARPTKHFTYMYITTSYLLERQFSEQLAPHHDHPGHPEEQDVVSRLQ